MAGRKPRAVDPDKVVKGFSVFFPVVKRQAVGMIPIYLYMQLTEMHTEDDWKRLDRGELTPAQKALKENPVLYTLLMELRNLFQLSSYKTMLKAYKAGNITQELQKILLRVPSIGGHDNGDGGFYSETMEALSGNVKRYEQAVVKAVESGDLDFSPYNKTGGKDKLWFLLYRLAPNPVPGYFGTIENWEKRGGKSQTTLQAEHETVTEKIKTKVKEALQDGVSPDAVAVIANEIRAVYNANKTAGRLNVWNGLYRHGTDYETGFVVDLGEKKIFDLRDYTGELLELLEPGFEPLKEFSQLLKRSIKEYKQQQQQPVLFSGDRFPVMYNDPQTNLLVNLTTYHEAHGKDETGKQKIPKNWNRRGYYVQNMFTEEWEFKNGFFEYSLPVRYELPKDKAAGTLKPDELEKYLLPPSLNESQWRLLHYFLLLFTLQNDKARESGAMNLKVNTTVREIMRAQNKKTTPQNVKVFAQKVKKDLETLVDFQLKKIGKQTLKFRTLLSSADLKRGEIEAVISLKLAESLVTQGYLMSYPPALQGLAGNNPNLYPLGYYLAVRNSSDKNIINGVAEIVSVEKALQNCPGIPTIERVREQRNSAEKRIITPFENVLNQLQEQNILESWEYCLAKGKPLENPDVSSYDYFKTLYIKYKVKGFVFDTERVEENERQRAEAEAKKKRAIAMNKKKKAQTT